MQHSKRIMVAAVALLGLAACSSSERVGGASVPVTDSTVAGTSTTLASTSTTVEASTTLAPETTVAATTAPTPAPTAAPTPAALLLLLGDGIGTASFGDTDDAVLALLTAGFGGVVTDTSETLDVNVGVDSWQSADGELQYTARIARDVCFANGLCAVFGGPDAANLAFTGYYLRGDSVASSIVTIEGIHPNDTWAAHLGAITRSPGGCYTYGTGVSTDGITVGMVAATDMFNYFDEATGLFVDGAPDPATVTIVDLSAGDLVISLFADC